MAYQTGTATGANDLLDKLRLFAIEQGWTVNRWVAAGSGRELCLSKGSAYFNFRSYQNETVLVNGSSYTSRYGISMNGSDGYDEGSAWDRQPGYPVRSSGPPDPDQGHAYMPFVVNQGPFVAYHFFAPDNKTIYLELEITTGTFLRLGFGSLDLFNSGTPGGGRFFYSTGGNGGVTNSVSSSSWLGENIDNNPYSLEEVPFRAADYTEIFANSGSFVRAAFDSFDNWCGSARAAANTYMMQACQGGGVHDRLIRDLSPNPMNGIGILTPNIVSVNRANEYLHPIGVVPGMRYMDMTNYLPGDEFTIGADTWKVFPWYNKGGRSYQRGIAYKKVT
jgi:hypothetical protein